jgi:hypothetical protein
MNTPVIAIIIVVALIAGGALAIMNKASNSSYQALCAPFHSLRHHYSAGCLITTADLRYRQLTRQLRNIHRDPPRLVSRQSFDEIYARCSRKRLLTQASMIARAAISASCRFQ